MALEEDMDEIKKRLDDHDQAFQERRHFERDQQIKMYKQTLARCSFRDYDYSNLPIGPCVAFYKMLARKPEGNKKQQSSTHGRLKIFIPDTLVYGDGDNSMWFYSSKEGYVYRTDTFSEREIMKRLGSKVDSDLVAVAKRPHWENAETMNALQLLDSKDLRMLVASPPQGRFAIQKYVKSKGPKAFVARCVWNRNRTGPVWVISSRKNYDTITETDFKRRYVTSTEEPGSVTIFKMTGKAVNELQELNYRHVRYVERNTPLKFEEFIADYVKDDNNRWWQVQVKGFTMTQDVDLPLTLTMGEEEEEEYTEAKQGDVSEQEYRKLLKCKGCQSGYLPQDLTYELTLKMILWTEQHLTKRGVILPFFGQAGTATAAEVDSSSFYQPYRVCKNCFDLYLSEKSLSEVELKFAAAIGIPLQDSVAENAVIGKAARGEQLEKHVMPADWRNDIPTGVAVRVEKNPFDIHIPKKLYQYRLMVFFHELHDMPDMKNYDEFGTNYLQYTIFNYTTKMPLRMHLRQDGELPVHKLRVFYFFGTPEGFEQFLEKQETLSVALYNTLRKNDMFGSVSFELKQFASGILDKMEYYQLFGGKELGICSVKLSIGIVRDEEIDTDRLKRLTYHKGIYVAEPSYFSCTPLPNAWMELLPQQSARVIRPPLAVERAPGESSDRPLSAVSNSSTPSGGAPRADAEEEGTTHSQMDIIVEDDNDLEEQDLDNFVSSSDPKKVWNLSIQVHAAHGVNPAPETMWAIAYEIFGRRVTSPQIASVPSRPLIFDTVQTTRLRASASALAVFLSKQANALVSVHVLSESGDVVGKALLNLEELPLLECLEEALPIALTSTISEKGPAEGKKKVNPWLSLTVLLEEEEEVTGIRSGRDTVIVEREADLGVEILKEHTQRTVPNISLRTLG
jgi:hypothetical protein